MIFQDKIIFIVGNSRSGTTLMLRTLNNHPALMVLNELHFFEQLWSPEDKGKIITKEQAILLCSKLLLIQRVGYMTHDQDYTKFTSESTTIINKITNENLTAEEVFLTFMKYEVTKNGKSIICEKTPQNVFYIAEIFELFPNAKIINMVRDPRAILLSQKNKWNRRNLGANYMTQKEALRLRINYHPITLSKLWNAAINAANQFNNDSRMLTVRFEDLLVTPENTLQKISQHIGVNFNEKMLEVTQESSSIEQDSKQIGFKKERADNWKNGGLNKTEIWICQKMCATNLDKHNYKPEKIQPNILLLIYYTLSFPVKIILALTMNLNRMKNIAETLKRRMK